MSTGTEIVQNALSHLKAHSPVKQAHAESLEQGRKMLNGMIARWQDDNIDFGAVPLQTIGGELSEPLGVKNGVEFNLAREMQSLFTGRLNAEESMALKRNATLTFNEIKKRWKTYTIPKQVVRNTLPQGQGNRDTDRTFFKEGGELGAD